MMINKKISVIIASYNESENIPEIYRRLTETLSKSVSDYEIIFVDNASVDGSENLYREISAKDSHIKAVLMSRNFGSSQTSFLAGLENCSGDAAVVMDGDLQDPPEVIADFIKKWQDGFDVVYGIRKSRKGNIVRRIGYKLFYRLFKKMAYVDIPLDAGDFSLMDRKVIDWLLSCKERDLFIRGLRSYIGFRQTGVEYLRDARFAGAAGTSIFTDIQWAKKLIINFSYKPLEWVSKLALTVVFIAFVAIIYNLTFYFIDPTAPRGMPTVIVALLFFSGIQLFCISVVAEYLGKIFQEVKNRPRYIVREIIQKKNDSLIR